MQTQAAVMLFPIIRFLLYFIYIGHIPRENIIFPYLQTRHRALHLQLIIERPLQWKDTLLPWIAIKQMHRC